MGIVKIILSFLKWPCRLKHSVKGVQLMAAIAMHSIVDYNRKTSYA
jgi:hypothetical protein